MNFFIQFLTYFRILAAPIIFLLVTLYSNYGWALILFLFAGASDYWDGYLARKYKLESISGAVLDPIADKILLTFIILALSLELSSPLVAFIGGVILVREFWVGGLRDLNARRGNDDVTKVSRLAKIKTFVQFSALLSFLFGLYLNNALIIFLSNFLLFLALIITLKTGLSYTIATFKITDEN